MLLGGVEEASFGEKKHKESFLYLFLLVNIKERDHDAEFLFCGKLNKKTKSDGVPQTE